MVLGNPNKISQSGHCIQAIYYFGAEVQWNTTEPIPDIPYGPQTPAGIIPKCRMRTLPELYQVWFKIQFFFKKAFALMSILSFWLKFMNLERNKITVFSHHSLPDLTFLFVISVKSLSV